MPISPPDPAAPDPIAAVTRSHATQVRKDLGIEVVPIVTLTQLIAFLKESRPEEAARLQKHKDEHCSC